MSGAAKLIRKNIFQTHKSVFEALSSKCQPMHAQLYRTRPSKSHPLQLSFHSTCFCERLPFCYFSRTCANDSKHGAKNTWNLNSEGCPQGIQGDDCTTFELWKKNCQKYGLQNCNEQLQGVQSGRKTMGEILAEQEKIIAEIAKQYAARNDKHSSSFQGSQDNAPVFTTRDDSGHQGVQESTKNGHSSDRHHSSAQGAQDSSPDFSDNKDYSGTQGIQGTQHDKKQCNKCSKKK